jgi:TPR repeat protein
MARSIAELEDHAAANPDDTIAINRLAVMRAEASTCHSGITLFLTGIDKVRFLEKAVSLGCPVAQKLLADHLWAHNRKDSRARITSLYFEAATAGLNIAQLALGESLQLGLSARNNIIDYEAGFQWIIRAAASGLPEAQASVSFAYRRGRADGNHSEFRIIHPRIGMAKHGVEPVKAFTYASRSANQENVEGICELAQCWEAGVGCVASEESATASLVKAADLGLTNALFYLGMICFDRGERGDESQFEQAIRWFMKADEKGMIVFVSYKAIWIP